MCRKDISYCCNAINSCKYMKRHKKREAAKETNRTEIFQTDRHGRILWSGTEYPWSLYIVCTSCEKYNGIEKLV